MSHDASNATGGAFKVSLAVEMDAFDSLGPRGRAALNSARFEFSAESIRQVLATLEVLATLGASSFSQSQIDCVVEKIVLTEDAALLAAAPRLTVPDRTDDAPAQPSTCGGGGDG